MKEFNDILEIGHPVELSNHYGFVDVTGKIFEFMKVIEYRGIKNNKSLWLCECSCIDKKLFLVNKSLNIKNSMSCGCMRATKVSVANTTHGMTNTTEFESWHQMKSRCCNPKNKDYHNYGGRRITVCERWLESFENFFLDMGPRPEPEYSIDRIDVNGNYCPENCKWATKREQANNKRKTRKIEYNGQTYSLSQFCEIFNVIRSTFTQRLDIGWPIEKAMKPTIEIDGRKI